MILRDGAFAADPFLLLELAVLEPQVAQGVVGHGLFADKGHLDRAVGEGALFRPVLVTFPA